MEMKFGEVRSINVDDMKVVPIRAVDGRPLYLTTGKCFSFGVKTSNDYGTKSMSLKLDDVTAASLRSVLAKCGEHMGSPLTKRLFYKDDTVYAKLKSMTKFYEGSEEVSVSEYENRLCDVKAVLEIGCILFNGESTCLQLKVYEALVREPKHVRMIRTEF